MIISKEVEVVIGNRNFKYYKELGYQFNKVDDIIVAKIEHLTSGSHANVDIKCDYCGKELKVPYKRYHLNTKVVSKYACSGKECSNSKIKDVCNVKYGVDNPFQSEEVKRKTRETLMSKYGVEHPMYLEATKDKIKDTCLERYGVDSYNKTTECVEKIKATNLKKYGVEFSSNIKGGQEKRKTTRVERGLQVPDELVSDYRKYRLSVNRITHRLKKEIINKWDGFDYYDGEYIKEYFNLNPNDRNYPQLDHKISVIYGFYNQIDPEDIGKITNICITKQWINGLKKEKCELEFIEEFKK